MTISYNNHRLFVGNIPKNRDRDELFEEFSKHARKCAKCNIVVPMCSCEFVLRLLALFFVLLLVGYVM